MRLAGYGTYLAQSTIGRKIVGGSDRWLRSGRPDQRYCQTSKEHQPYQRQPTKKSSIHAARNAKS